MVADFHAPPARPPDAHTAITDPNARAAIKRQMEEWRGEVDTIKCNLIEIGSRPDSLEYNLAATEALRLALCINDLASLLLEDAG